jgi:GT2 family glycosyltransferase
LAVTNVSIVIPTLGRATSIHEVIAGLERQTPRTELEVLVITDADGAGEEVGKLDQGARSFPLTLLTVEREGVSAKRNRGWRAANAPLILFLDDDIVPSRRLVAEHIEWHRRHPEPEVGVLGAVRWSRRVKVTPFMRWLEMGIQFDYRNIEGPEAGWGRFYTCNASVKRGMLERAGGFDEENFPFGYEDLELAKRMADDGFRLLFNPRAVGEHLKTETFEAWKRNLRRNAIAELRFTAMYPDQRPYFHDRFLQAAQSPPARGRAARLARFVRPGVPGLGPVVWRSYDAVCAQRLAPEFLAEWEAARAELAAAPSAGTAAGSGAGSGR